MDELPMTVAVRLKAIRARMGISQGEMSRMSGIPIDTYKKYEGGTRTPGGKHLARLSAIGVDLAELVAGGSAAALSSQTAEQPRAGYGAVNVEILAFVLAGVDKELPDAKSEERAAIAAFAYHHMLIVGTKDEQALAGFFRGYWASRGSPPPFDPASPEVSGRAGAKPKAGR